MDCFLFEILKRRRCKYIFRTAKEREHLEETLYDLKISRNSVHESCDETKVNFCSVLLNLLATVLHPLYMIRDGEYMKITYVNCGLRNEYESNVRSTEHYFNSSENKA